MPRRTRGPSHPIDQYTYPDETRTNNPPIGLVTSETDGESRKKQYHFDPYLSPELQWSGKTEHDVLDMDTVSLHVHERIDTSTIIDALRTAEESPQLDFMSRLFEQPQNNPPLRQAVDFYKHPQNWTNRLIAGDSLLVMNSLLEKEGMGGKVHCAMRRCI